ncbi:hypothetical protein PAPYR_2608 [Paratrimastix pyriformis]|uniref:Uncharacterized protein n=1 Tax=Paratrimastix pyriformis TaxID=342808 RepID=A0ABQ8UWK1_9EUKA|nr:hypothetical protein PAPYR_2608 [Paratrimastix pyriformis]
MLRKLRQRHTCYTTKFWMIYVYPERIIIYNKIQPGTIVMLQDFAEEEKRGALVVQTQAVVDQKERHSPGCVFRFGPNSCVRIRGHINLPDHSALLFPKVDNLSRSIMWPPGNPVFQVGCERGSQIWAASRACPIYWTANWVNNGWATLRWKGRERAFPETEPVPGGQTIFAGQPIVAARLLPPGADYDLGLAAENPQGPLAWCGALPTPNDPWWLKGPRAAPVVVPGRVPEMPIEYCTVL